MLYTTAQTGTDLQQILMLQQNNLPTALTEQQMAEQGFVTVIHDEATLHKMNDIAPHIIAKHNDQVVAYLLAMTPQCKNDLPILLPLFDAFYTTEYNGQYIAHYRYIVVGQACVAQAYRGQGILDQCYAYYRHTYQNDYDFAITEIAHHNQRSLNAHRRIGFRTICQYQDPDGISWHIVLWDWHTTI